MSEVLEKFTITNEIAEKLYKFIRETCDGDAFRYEMLAKKVCRVESGWASEFDESIVKDWLKAMQDIEAEKAEAEILRVGGSKFNLKPFDVLKTGKCGNPIYQAYLDTLEQDALDKIENNVGYFAWHSDRMQELYRKYPERWMITPEIITNHTREYADNHLSERVKKLNSQ